MIVNLDTSDMRDWARALRQIPADMLKQCLRPAVRSAATIVKAEQKRLLRAQTKGTDLNPHTRGVLQRAISAVTVRANREQSPTTATVLIGILRKAGPLIAPQVTKRALKGQFWWYLERGFHVGGRRRGRFHKFTYRHFVAAKPFVGPSALNVRSQVVQRLQDKLNAYASGSTPLTRRARRRSIR
jgi:hypothetical protein